MLPVEQSFKLFTDLDGKPLNNGFVYFGQPDQNPVTNPITVFWDAAGTIPAAQPLRTMNGYALRAGTPANLFISESYSQLVLDSKKRQVSLARNSDDFSLATAVSNISKGLGAGTVDVGFTPLGAGGRKRTLQEKAQEAPSFADRGASGTGDARAAIQAALDIGFGQIGDEVYLISAPLKLPSMSAFAGNRAGAAFTGATPNVKRAIKKTTNTPVAVVNFETNASTSVDCLLYMDPAWIDGGVSYPQRSSIERQAFQGNAASPNFACIYIEQGSGYALRDLQMSHVIHAIYVKSCWSSVFENIQTTGKIVWVTGGTSCTFTNVGTGAGPGSTGGWSLASLIYSVFNGCWNDGTTDTGWRLVNCDLTFNGCGIENGSAGAANSGTAFAFDGGNKVVLNGFCVVPVKNQVVTPYTVGFDNTITFNQGTAYFGVPGVNCPDIYIWGNGSTVIFNDYTFVNGSKDNPIIQFAPGVSTSKVIVNYGANTKIFTSTGDGITHVESLYDGGDFLPVLAFANAGAAPTYASRSGNWRKSGKVITISGRIALSSKGTGSGQALISGWPTFAQSQDTPLHLVLQTGVVGGPLAGVVDKNGAAQAVFNVRTATGDGAATEANFSNGTVLWFEFDYITD